MLDANYGLRWCDHQERKQRIEKMKSHLKSHTNEESHLSINKTTAHQDVTPDKHYYSLEFFPFFYIHL